VYNTSVVVLAKIDTAIARDEFSRQLQAHLLEVTRGYWGLYLERASLLQKRRLHERAQEILDGLEARRELDAVASQIIRVKAAVTARQADLYRAETAVRNAEERIQALINDPQLALVEGLELVPTDALIRDEFPLEMPEALTAALQERPEIGQSLKQIQAASVRLDMARHELLPRLDAVLQGYVSGLQGNSAIDQAWANQFNVGQPSYSSGLVFEVPIYNRAAKMRHERRKLELRQLENQFRTTVETLMLEVKVAVREVVTTYRETQARYQSMVAAGQQLEYIEQRWRHLPGEDRDVNLYLEDVLAAQERLAAAEYGFLQAETTYNLSLMNLKRATGTLLQDEQITFRDACVDCLPTTVLEKQPNFEQRPQSYEPLPQPVLTEPAASATQRPNSTNGPR
jgi:outer membrane protein TolC